ncbi:hypothetical protein FB451DRAFT_1407760 [Mycena latifolia]|nr:hypothetical protein FB451DRAFT_1407760 [Mycena latifolia]
MSGHRKSAHSSAVVNHRGSAYLPYPNHRHHQRQCTCNVAPEPSPRFVLTRAAKKDLATSAAAPSLSPDALLVSPPKPPSAHPRPRAFPPCIAPHRNYVYSPNTHPPRPQMCSLLLRGHLTPPSSPNRPPMEGDQRV